jgi:hydroxyacylglutathione hydrolase
MLIETRAAAPFFKNGFVLACAETRQGIIIDPGDEVAELLSIVDREKLDIRYVLLTHAHMDHVSGVGRASAATGAPIALHADDNFLYETADQQARLFGLDMRPPPPSDFFYDPDARLSFGVCEVRVHHTPGHSPGGVCLQVVGQGDPVTRLFVGDTLFAGSIGRTDLPGGDYATLIRSIREVLFGFGDEAEVYPGHGPATTIGEERRTNPFLV